jgi:glycosyltransferase involved in cell wall biosynthesis
MSEPEARPGIRVTYLDDAPHLRWEGRIYAANATFHRFAARLLDVDGPDGSPAIAALTACVPVRAADGPPGTLPLDERIRVVATAPFDGIAGFVPRAPLLLARNLRPLRRAIASADVVLLRLPASNGILAATLARMQGVPRLGYVAGSAAAVVAGQARGGPAGLAARLVAAAYDRAGVLATLGAERVVVGRDLAGSGIVASLVAPGEIVPVADAWPWPRDPGVLRLAWAGRLASGKGVEELLEAVARLRADPPEGRDVRLVLLGDGPAAGALLERASALGLAGAVTFLGYVAARPDYLAALTGADIFVHPSPAEGFPKVILDAMAVGVPVLATPAGTLAEIVCSPADGPGPHRPLDATGATADAIETALRRLLANPVRANRIAVAGSAFASAHTDEAEAARLAGRLLSVAAKRPLVVA